TAVCSTPEGYPRVRRGPGLRDRCGAVPRPPTAPASPPVSGLCRDQSNRQSDPVSVHRGSDHAGRGPDRPGPAPDRRAPRLRSGFGLPALPGHVADRAARAAVAAPAPLEIGLVALAPAMGAQRVEHAPGDI